MDKPKHRSKIRIIISHAFFTVKKVAYWYLSNTKFAKQERRDDLTVEIFKHNTPLLRRLAGLDMQLQYNKITNLQIAINKLDKIVIQPGETLSYWRAIGNPTKSKGYLEGMVLSNVKVKRGTGGGLCQLSNLIFWITLHTPLTVTERWRHSYDVFPDANRTQPFGSGATCAYPNIDLQITNKTQTPFQLNLNIDNSNLIGSWSASSTLDREYKITEQDHEMKNEWWGGYTRHNKLVKQTIDKNSNDIISEEVVIENHAIMMYDPLIECEDENHTNI